MASARLELEIRGRRGPRSRPEEAIVGAVCPCPAELVRDSRSACRKGEKPQATMAWALSKGLTGDGGRLRRKETPAEKKRKERQRRERKTPADRPEQRWGDGPRYWYWADLVLLFLKAVIQRSRYPYIQGFFSAVGGFGANALWRPTADSTRLAQACQDSKRCPRDPGALYRYSLLVLGLRTQSLLPSRTSFTWI